MRTAISVPDALFRRGERLAKRLGVSRSELYAIALDEFVAKHRVDRLIQRMDAADAEDTMRLDPAFVTAQMRILTREEW